MIEYQHRMEIIFIMIDKEFKLSQESIKLELSSLYFGRNVEFTEKMLNNISNEIYSINKSLYHLSQHEYKIKKIRKTGFVINDFIFFTDFAPQIGYTAGDLLIHKTPNLENEHRINIKIDHSDFYCLLDNPKLITFSKDQGTEFSRITKEYLMYNLNDIATSNPNVFKDNLLVIKSMQPFLRYLNQNMTDVNTLFKEDTYYSLQDLSNILLNKDTLFFADLYLLENDNDIYFNLKANIDKFYKKKIHKENSSLK